jgi:hypothetical protein
MAIFWTGDLFFVYINVLKKHHIQEPTLSNLLFDFIADSFLYNFGGSSLYKMKTKALAQTICP